MRLTDQLTAIMRNSDPQQLRRLGNIARFFAALLVVTLVARGTAGDKWDDFLCRRPAIYFTGRAAGASGAGSGGTKCKSWRYAGSF